MKKANLSSFMIIDRLEKKYQKKVRFQRYKTISKHLRQRLSGIQGVPAKDVNDDSLDTLIISDYEYIGR